MMRHFNDDPRFWTASAALFAVAAILSVVTLPVVESWYDQWRAFADMTTVLASHCTDAANTDNPECQPGNEGFTLELWTIAPWLLSMCCFLSSLAIAMPFVRRRRHA